MTELGTTSQYKNTSTTNVYVNELKVNPEYARLVHPLTDLEYGPLRSSIKKNNGNIVPIVVNQKGIIIDGHHRHRICIDLNIKPNFEVRQYDDELSEKEDVIILNNNRRHLNDYQKSELAYELEKIYSEKARLRQLSGLKNVNPSSLSNDNNDETVGLKNVTSSLSNDNNDKGRTSELVSKVLGIAPTQYMRCKKIILLGSDDVKEKLRAGKTKPFKEYKKIQVEEKKNLLRNEKQKIDLPEGCKLYKGDFLEVGKKIPDNSVDLILTDPPYRMEDLYIFENLAKFAQRALKEGGSLVLFAGQYDLLLKGNILEKSGLKFRWQICVKHTGHYGKMHGFGTVINVAWKPLIWFVKGNNGRTNNEGFLVDYVESEPPAKVLHEWEQSPVEAEHVIKGLTLENQIVVDPCMGAGTFGIAALRQGRKFVGFEIDEERFEIGQANIKSALSLMNKNQEHQHPADTEYSASKGGCEDERDKDEDKGEISQ